MKMKLWTAGLVLLILAAVGGGWILTRSGGADPAGETARQGGTSPGSDTAQQGTSPGSEKGQDQPPSPSAAKTPSIPAEKADVVIVGTEMEGMYLARAAADEGLTVRVIDPYDGIGGQLLQAEMLFLDETKDDSGKSLVQGRVKELFDQFKQGKLRKLSEYETLFSRLTNDIPIESGITITSVQFAQGVSGKEHVDSITYTAKDGTQKTIAAANVVENTDNGSLTAHLKKTRLPGLESVYGLPQIEYMTAGYMMKFKNIDWDRFQKHFNGLSQEERRKLYGTAYINESFAIALTDMVKKYTATDDLVFLRGLNAVNQRDGEVLINALLVYDVDPSKPESVAAAMERGKKELPLIRDHFRKHIVGWEKAEINGYPNHLYIREYDHYETDYVLQVSDALGGRMFWDNVSIAGYPLDLQGTKTAKWGIEMGRPDKYGMPLRSFLLKQYDNVIMAGKNVGASAIAYGSARIQPNTALAAETIGILLKQLAPGQTLAEVTEADMKKLHELLAAKYGIVLSGVKGANKIAGWTEDEISRLNVGKIIFPSYSKTRKASGQ
ncbi:FAD-dependent oxidoreductase [Paenibacillus turpanensis]|uniref:FAD-dependent oxidoreductase n=1 Tax=Paenibacillus turpanensis TaxID=2689078 RepID=UPI0014096D42|nr:FAD-dependent oxidoreductase [Paenibacillus turpanensis]